MKHAVKKIPFFLYLLRVGLTAFYLVFLIMLVPNIFSSSWQGVLFLFTSLALVGVTLLSFLSKSKRYQDATAYNLIYIALVGYIFLIWSKVFLDVRVQLHSLYQFNMTYFEINYLLLSIVNVGIVLNTLFIYYEEKKGL